MDFYHLPLSAPCQSVRLLAKALGLHLNLKELDLMNGEHLKPDFLKQQQQQQQQQPEEQQQQQQENEPQEKQQYIELQTQKPRPQHGDTIPSKQHPPACGERSGDSTKMATED
uniref:GST N-terminal domain-containing protein n=1 Tax=Anopheles dirus TaxID=7168 RepID=A0A182NCS6_9DIPT